LIYASHAALQQGPPNVCRSVFQSVRCLNDKEDPFQTTHALEFDLEVVSKDARGDVNVQCLFCVYEGRDAIEVGGSSGRKRKACTTIK
jgi:hypothetical protein